MSATRKKGQSSSLVAQLKRLRDDEAKRRLLLRNRHQWSPELASQLAEDVVRTARKDSSLASALADAAILVAEEINDEQSLANSYRAKGNALYFRDDYQPAVDHHKKAIRWFEELDNPGEVAVTSMRGIADAALGRHEERQATPGRHGVIRLQRRGQSVDLPAGTITNDEREVLLRFTDVAVKCPTQFDPFAGVAALGATMRADTE